MLEQQRAQYTAACENQGKQCKLTNYWKLLKTLSLTKNDKGCAKKTNRLAEIQVLTKDFTSYKITQLVKPINY